jgi:hypothetical protein
MLLLKKSLEDRVMSTQVSSDLLRFHQFIGEKLSNGGLSLSPEDALDEWRAQSPFPEEKAATIQAVREALQDIAAGHTQSLEDFDQEFRRNHNMSQAP